VIGRGYCRFGLIISRLLTLLRGLALGADASVWWCDEREQGQFLVVRACNRKQGLVVGAADAPSSPGCGRCCAGRDMQWCSSCHCCTAYHNQRSAGGAAAALQQLRGPWVVRAYWLMTTAVDVAVLRYVSLLAVSL
jgi:hypothetical protein